MRSFSLHSSTVYFGSSKVWSRNDSDMLPAKSSIGEISSRMSARPEVCGTSSRPAAAASAARSCQRSLPSNQSNEVVCRLSRSGTSRGSPSFAKVTRGEAVRSAMSVVRSVLEAAKGGSFHRPMTESQARRTPVGRWSRRCRGQATEPTGDAQRKDRAYTKSRMETRPPKGLLHPRRPLYAWRGVLVGASCPSVSTGPAVSSHRAHAAGSAPYGKKCGRKSSRSQAGGPGAGVSGHVRALSGRVARCARRPCRRPTRAFSHRIADRRAAGTDDVMSGRRPGAPLPRACGRAAPRDAGRPFQGQCDCRQMRRTPGRAPEIT